MKALITGAAGFIGAHVYREVRKQGMDVVAIDDLSGGFRGNLPADAVFVEGSVTDAALLERMFEEHRFDCVYHLAAYAAEGLSHFIRRFNYETNLMGSINLINLAVTHGVGCFVFTSSIAVYGGNQVPMTEETVPRPEDPYGISKYAVELDLAAAHHLFGLNYVVFRPHNVYGELQNIGDKYRNVIGIFMNQALQGRPFTVFGDGMQTRAFTYIGDIAPVIAAAPLKKECWQQVFNVGSDDRHTVKCVAEVVAREMGVSCELRHLRERKEVVHAYASHEKLRRYFLEAPATGIEEGVRRMATWVKTVGARSSKDFGDIEIRKGLPEGW